MTELQLMQRIDALLSHVWMVRTFLKHSDEATGDEELQEIFRTLYDGMHALGKHWSEQDAKGYLKTLRKKLPKMNNATEVFIEVQPEISGHTNFRMAASSLQTAMKEISALLEESAKA